MAKGGLELILVFVSGRIFFYIFHLLALARRIFSVSSNVSEIFKHGDCAAVRSIRDHNRVQCCCCEMKMMLCRVECPVETFRGHFADLNSITNQALHSVNHIPRRRVYLFALKLWSTYSYEQIFPSSKLL